MLKKSTNKKFGVLYVATGRKIIAEACRSAASLKKYMPDTQIAIFVDDESLIPPNLFDYVNSIKNPTYSHFDKIPPLIETPFNKTLFLDSDTLVIEPFHELPTLLERFDFAYCHAPWRFGEYNIPECSDAFPQPNSGVILYNKTNSVLDLINRWLEIYKKQLTNNLKPPHDQSALRKAVYESAVNFTILPSEYNIRTHFPYFVGGNVKAKILHGRGPAQIIAKSTINKKLVPYRNLRPRVGNGIMYHKYGYGQRLKRKIANKIKSLLTQFSND